MFHLHHRSQVTAGRTRGGERSGVPSASSRESIFEKRSARICASVAALAVLFVVPGCGQESNESESSGHRSEATTAEQVGSNVPASSIAAAVMERSATSTGGMLTDTTGSLPPDIVVSVPDTVVMPGDPVEVTVQGTSDVTEVILWDGLNDRQALVFDGRDNLWRVTYRVPLEPTRERWGVSLTAKTPANRWRRVWVFFTRAAATPPLAPAPASPDS